MQPITLDVREHLNGDDTTVFPIHDVKLEERAVDITLQHPDHSSKTVNHLGPVVHLMLIEHHASWHESSHLNP